jgi:hypothetical protein
VAKGTSLSLVNLACVTFVVAPFSWRRHGFSFRPCNGLVPADPPVVLRGSQVYMYTVATLYMHARMHARTHAHTHACMHACKFTHACTHARTHACTHARTHACTHARTHMHACMHARTQVCTHACTHARTHNHTHKHTQGVVVTFVCSSHHIIADVRPTPCSYRGNERTHHMPRHSA